MHPDKIVLTLDGSRLMRAMLSHHFARYGCSILEASDPTQARDLVREHRPALIVANGTLLPFLQRDEECAAIPTIALMARVQDEERAAAVTATACLLTPFHAQNFDREVSEILGAPRGSGR